MQSSSYNPAGLVYQVGVFKVTGIFILTLPIPIVVTSFAACYKNRLWRNEITMKKRMVSSYNHKDHRHLAIVYIILSFTCLSSIELHKENRINIDMRPQINKFSASKQKPCAGYLRRETYFLTWLEQEDSIFRSQTIGIIKMTRVWHPW